jgi:hypothetical protein
MSYIEKLNEERGVPNTERVFPKAISICCHQLPERRQFAMNEYVKHGLNVQVMEGLYGWSYGLVAMSFTLGRNPVMGPGHVALNLNHWMIYQYAWLAEDCVFVENFKERFFTDYDRLPKDWEIWAVGHVKTDDGLTTLKKHICGTHCYMVKRSALPVLLQDIKLVEKQIDVWLYDVATENSLKYYKTPYSLADQMTNGKWKSSANNEGM